MYKLFETNEFIKSIGKLQQNHKKVISSKLKEYVYPQIKSEPHFGANIKKLKNYNPETWRYRIGRHRIFYTIDEDDNLVMLLVIEDRSKAYPKN